MKRLIDFCLGLFLFMQFLPVMIVVGVLVTITSPGGALYRQKRVGRGGRLFTIYKFRSMVSNADQVGGHSTQAEDARITKVGRFIRKTSLDELPQLWNVVIGDMSLVGPRPDTPMQKTDYSEADWEKRCSVRPGITGLSQATMRSTATPEQRTSTDLDYIDRQSIALDFKILSMTVKQVFSRGGN